MSRHHLRHEVIAATPPDAAQLRGLVGGRLDLNRLNRLHFQEADHLLFPFQEHCPVGMDHPDRPREEIRGDWQGEYIGTWLDAAILSAHNSGDPALRAKIDDLVADWLATQEADGYLGTYDEGDRWKSWDIWVQAHDLIGLISYFRLTGKPDVLLAAVRVADRVLMDFGPGKAYLHETGHHQGMASSSFLEPVLWLYAETHNPQYLDFARWLVDEDWEHPNGPRIVSSLLAGRGVAGTANAKGIEMLICFAGLVELYRATGEERYLAPVIIAWDDIARHHLYITGSASTGEYFRHDYLLRNDGFFQLGETCVSMGWLYLNLLLGRLTGSSRYFDMAEQTLYNHLLGAQSPDGRGWAYYLGLRDHKRYRWHIDPECCPTRGVRALAQLPLNVFGIDAEGLVVNFYESATGRLVLDSGVPVTLEVVTDYPFDGVIRLHLHPDGSEQFSVRLRLPGWCERWALRVNQDDDDAVLDEAGYLRISRVWQPGDVIELTLDMPVQIARDNLGNSGRVAIVRGPLVYAMDNAYLPPGHLLDDMTLVLPANAPASAVELVSNDETGSLHLLVPVGSLRLGGQDNVWGIEERYRRVSQIGPVQSSGRIALVPFYEAGNRAPDIYRDGVSYRQEPQRDVTFQVWLPCGTA
jgi:DUF1680 family protein